MSEIDEAYRSPKSFITRKRSFFAIAGGLLLLIVFLIPAIHAAREAARRTRSSKMLRQTKALENYYQVDK